MSSSGPVSYVSDLEGQWERLLGTVERDSLLSLDGDRLVLAEGATFVFGGDALDRGPASRRLLRLFLDARARYGDRVVLLAGNRDLNKLRLATELDGAPPANTPDESLRDRVTLLQHIFLRTMGAGEAFAHRASELSSEGRDASDEAVVASFVEDLAPEGLLSRYLAECSLAYRHEQTLFVHGGLGPESFGVVPGIDRRFDDVDDFVLALNRFLASRIEAFRARRPGSLDRAPWGDLVDYQAPTPGLHENPRSVVYGRLSDPQNNPMLPPDSIIDALARSGVHRLVVGHSPSGDLPAFVRGDTFELVVADNSRGRVETGSSLRIEGELAIARGRTRLDDGSSLEVESRTRLGERSAVGLRFRPDGRLVKAVLGDGSALTYRGLPRYLIEQVRIESSDLATLESPTRDGF